MQADEQQTTNTMFPEFLEPVGHFLITELM